MSKVFLGGPISNAMRNNVFDKKIEKDINKIYEKLKNEGYKILSAHRSEDFGRNSRGVEKIFEVDISWIRKAKIAIFVLFYNKEEDCLLRTDGSYIEIGMCCWKNIPITIISDAPKEKFPTIFPTMLQSMKTHNSDKVKFITLDEFLDNRE